MTRKCILQLGALFAGCLLTVPAFAAVDASSANIKWSYVGTDGPTHWGMLDPAFEVCDTGKQQSPVNMSRTRVSAPYSLRINYHTAPLYIGDDMATELAFTKTQKVVNSAHGLQVNFHGEARETLTFSGKEYELLQFHFHSPSETLWHKQDFPLEIHFVHQAKDGGVLVMAAFVKGGAENPAIKEILNHIPEKPHQEYAIAGTNINPADLLPANQRYFSYMGSLTTPPCTEGVQWIVLPETITAAPEQILEIRQATGGNNARPVQSMNGRTLYYAAK